MSRQVVLLVEDNPSDEALTRRALKKHGVDEDLVIVRDGAEAMDYLFGSGTFAGRDPAEAPRLVLLDLKLPKVSGLEVLKRLRADLGTRSIPVVVFTSSGEEDDVVAGYGLGCNSFVRKPIDFIQLNEALRQIATYWLSLNESLPTSLPRPRAG